MFDASTETMPGAGLVQLQAERLSAQLNRLRSMASDYWSEKLSGTGSIVSLEDIRSLPFTVKSEFREQYPYGMLAVPQEDLVRVHASSGTSGKPTIVAYTADDVTIFAEVNARALACAGATRDDVVHIAYGYGLFTGGLGLHYGVEALGATAVPASGGNSAMQVALLVDLGATGLACTPSYSLLLAERAAEAGVLDRIGLRWGIHGAEPWSEGMRAKIEGSWGEGYDACDIYGLSEVIGPGVAAECKQNKGGMHIAEDHFFPEIIDPETKEPVQEGEPGELVLTTLTRQAQPVIRFQTRDVTRFLPGPCRCGRTTRRIGRLEGRLDDMLIVRGINVYPRTIETILLADPDVGGQFAIIVDRRETLVSLRARVEVAAPSAMGRRGEIAARLGTALLEATRIRIEVEVGPVGALPRTETGKARRVFVQTTDEDPLLGASQ